MYVMPLNPTPKMVLGEVSCVFQFLKKGEWRASRCGSNPTSIHEVAGWTPGLAQGVKDLALPRAVVEVADMAQNWRCCGCGVGRRLQL